MVWCVQEFGIMQEYCLCLAHWVTFSTQMLVKSLTRAHQQRTDPYLKSPLCAEDPGRRYSFYRIGRVKPESACMTETNLFCRGWNLNSQSLDRQSSTLSLDNHCLTTLLNKMTSELCIHQNRDCATHLLQRATFLPNC